MGIFVTKQKKLAKGSWNSLLGKPKKEKKHKKIAKEMSNFIEENFR